MADMTEKSIDYAMQEHRPYGILIAGHYVEGPHYSIYRPSGSIDWLLLYTLSGEGSIRVKGEQFICREGDVAILQPGLPHEYKTHGESWDFWWTHFIPDPKWMFWLQLPELREDFVKLKLHQSSNRQAVHQAFERMIEYNGQSGSSLHGKLAMVALEETLLHLVLASSPRIEATLDPRIADLIIYLQREYRKPGEIPELAKRCYLSPSRLSHLFKEQVGDTILNTVHKIRAEKAAELLTFTSRQISEIAEDIGYNNTDHFTRMFQRVYGTTPSAYRKVKLAEANKKG